MSRLLLALLLCCAAIASAEPRVPADTGQGRVQLLEHKAHTQHPTLGPEWAPVRIEFFLNLSNARMARHHRNLLELAARHPKRLQIVYRLTDRREPSSNLSQIFGREAFAQGRFFEFMDAYYGDRRRPPASKDYPEVSEKAGVDYERVREALNSSRHDAVLSANHYFWRRMNVTKIPGLLVNGRPVAKLGTLETLERLYDEAYEEATALLASGVEPRQLRDHLLRSALADKDQRAPRVSGPLDGEPSEEPPRPIRMTELLQGKHRQGPANPRVTVVFICNLQTLLCRFMAKQLQTLRQAYKDEVELVFQPLFDRERTGQDKAALMYEAALCADEQQVFWEFIRYAFARRVSFDQARAVELASLPALDLDVPRFEDCLETGRFGDRVESEVALVRRAGVRKTPAVAISGVLYSGRLHFEDLRVLVDSELAPGLLETWGGP